MKRALVAAALLGTCWGLMASCAERDHGKPFGASGGSGAAASSGGGGGLDSGLMDGPPDPDAPGLCGNLVIPVVADPPNLYFVVDRSGSMADSLQGSTQNKYVNARIAIGSVLRAIGHRVSYGAAIFPAGPFKDSQDCSAGKQVFPTQPGDPPSYAAEGKSGPVLLSFLKVLGGYEPAGGTPTSATLAALSDTLTSLPGKTFVVLATDGAPNCNFLASCGVDKCMLNIEHVTVDGVACEGSFNCCDPALVQYGQSMCVDDAATLSEVAKLFDAGVRTFVIGMPGSEVYSGVLDALAAAGGTSRARPAKPHYYSVKDAEELTQALSEIGISVAISCSVELDGPPPDPELVNVYFDQKLVQLDPADGWSWTGEKTIEIHGAACAELESGDVLQLQVVAGCPTSVK